MQTHGTLTRESTGTSRPIPRPQPYNARVIRSGTVAIARSMSNYTPIWLASSLLLFLLQFIYPAAKLEVESEMWMSSLAARSDAATSAYILDGVLSWAGLLLGFCVSSVMYSIALRQWRNQEITPKEVVTGIFRFNEFLQLSFVAAVAGQASWLLASRNLAPPAAVFLQILFTWVVVTGAVFVVPLVIDRGMTAWQAVRTSLETVARQPGQAFILVLGAGFWSYIGVVLCGLGAVLTMPTYQLSIAKAYIDCFEDTPTDEPAEESAPEDGTSD